MGITFDGSLSVGAILNALVLLVSFVITFARIGGRIDLLTLRLEGVEKAVRETQNIDNRLAIIEERVTNHVSMLVQFQREMSEFRKSHHEEVQDLRKDIAGLRRDPKGPPPT